MLLFLLLLLPVVSLSSSFFSIATHELLKIQTQARNNCTHTHSYIHPWHLATLTETRLFKRERKGAISKHSQELNRMLLHIYTDRSDPAPGTLN